jgi:hypothetical protein
MIDFDTYIKMGEPGGKERAEAWKTAIGLQAVDGLKTSEYLNETAAKHIEGDITIEQVKELIDTYYQSKTARTPEDDDKEEPENNNTASQQTSKVSTSDMTLELVQRMVEWDKKKRVLEDWKWKAMDDVAQGRKPFTDRMKYAFYLNLERLKKFGFDG